MQGTTLNAGEPQRMTPRLGSWIAPKANVLTQHVSHARREIGTRHINKQGITKCKSNKWVVTGNKSKNKSRYTVRCQRWSSSGGKCQREVCRARWRQRGMVRPAPREDANAQANEYANEVKWEESVFHKSLLNKRLDSSLPEFTSCCSITPQPRTSSHSPRKLISISKEGWVKGK